MSDKKVSQQTEHTTQILGVDLLPIVSDISTTPANYRVQVKNFLKDIQIDLPQTSRSAFKLTSNITADANSAVFATAEFNMVANSSVDVTVEERHALVCRNLIQNGNSIVEGRMSVATFVLDVGDSIPDGGNTFGIVINHTLDDNVAAQRNVQPRAYIGIFEYAGNAAPDGVKTQYLMFADGVSSDVANANPWVILSDIGSATPTHTLKVLVNGVEYYLLASNVAPA